jgi:hypothetical protein
MEVERDGSKDLVRHAVSVQGLEHASREIVVHPRNKNSRKHARVRAFIEWTECEWTECELQRKRFRLGGNTSGFSPGMRYPDMVERVLRIANGFAEPRSSIDKT